MIRSESADGLSLEAEKDVSPDLATRVSLEP
jgi:hypothetical protein